MSTYRLYSDRLKDAAKAGEEDVYQYDYFSDRLRVQLRQILQDVFGTDRKYDQTRREWEDNRAAAWVHATVAREKGRDNFGYSKYPATDLLAFFQKAPSDDFIDILEVCCVAIETIVANSGYWRRNWDSKANPDEALSEINFRLRDAGVGFQFEGGNLLRVDSQFLHAETVKPALQLLNRKGFEGPQAEFLTAHEHYRAGRHKEAITEAAKAFESMMKAVCDAKGWEHPKGARASDLLKILRLKGLWPYYLDASFDQLIATLASGLPKVRNDDGAHGQGAVPKTVPSYVAGYALHLAAAKMLLLASAAATGE